MQTTLRPIDELAPDAHVEVRANASRVWLVDGKGVEYLPPQWLVSLIALVEFNGRRLAQAEMRAALGIDDHEDTSLAIEAEAEEAAQQILAAEAATDAPEARP
jgi:hypothetical protein